MKGELYFMEKSFMEIVKCYNENGDVVVKPTFLVRKNKELAIKDGEFFALWDNDEGCWVKDITEAAEIIDRRVLKFVEENCANDEPIVLLCEYFESGVFKQFVEYCRSLGDNYFEVYCPLV